jgi:hypothetical protein
MWIHIIVNHYNHSTCNSNYNNFNILGILSLQYKILCYLLYIVGGVYHPGFALVFIWEYSNACITT